MATSDAMSPTAMTQGSPLEVHSFLDDEKSSAIRQASCSSTASSGQLNMKGKRKADIPAVTRPKANSQSSRTSHSTSSTQAENRIAQRDVRTLPSWIDSVEEDDDEPSSGLRPTDALLSSPSRAHSAQHHYTPSSPSRRVSQDGYVDEWDEGSRPMPERRHETGFWGAHREPVPGRKWDHAREGDPVIMNSGILPTSSPWRNFIKASMYGPAQNEDPKQVDEAFLQQQTPGYEKPWRGDLDNEDDDNIFGLLHNKRQRKTFIKRLQKTILMHPFVPLTFRLTVLTTSIISLGLSASVFHLSHEHHYRQNSSTTMAVVVDAVAIPYIFYITWDEYTGKPLGLRSPRAKIRLVLLDLFFIIFEAANLALAFGALTDRDGSCQANGPTGFNSVVCHRIRTLCAILMIALVAWSLTFAISIFRLVERVGGREESD